MTSNSRYDDLPEWSSKEFVSPAMIEKEFEYSQSQLRALRNDPNLHFPKRYGTSRNPTYRRKRVEWWFREILGKDAVIKERVKAG